MKISVPCAGIHLAAIMCASAPVQAYVGPGAGLPLVGMLIALVMAVLLALVGFVWFPFRRLLRHWRKKRATAGEDAAIDEASPLDDAKER